MTGKKISLIYIFLSHWLRFITHYPWWILLLTLVGCVASLAYTIGHLTMNTDTSQMLSQDLPFQQSRLRFEHAFPQDAGSALILVEASTAERTTAATHAMTALLAQEKQTLESIYVPGIHRFFDEHGLLYLNLDELEALALELARAQPFMGRLAQDYSLNGLLSIIVQALEHQDKTLPVALEPLLKGVSEALAAAVNGDFYQLSWQQLMLGQNRDFIRTQQFILAKPVLDFSAPLPAEDALAAIRDAARHIETQFRDVRIRITGEVALEHEELEAASQGAVFSGALSLILVCTTLLIGLRSLKLMLATFVSLAVGLILTAGFTAVTIGHLNLISISFAALYIGLGVDYAIHLCLRYREYLHLPSHQALHKGVQALRPALALCALTTSIGFYAFVPTDYVGVSELGIISGTAMFIGLAVSLTVLPAVLSIVPLPDRVASPSQSTVRALYDLPFRYARPIQILSLLMLAAAIPLLNQTRFDSNPINMRNPDSESVSTFRDLLRSESVSPLTLTALAANRQAAQAVSAKLQALPSVKEVVTILGFVPDQQADKLLIIEELDLLLGTQLGSLQQPVHNPQSESALYRLANAVQQALHSRPAAEHNALQTLSAQLQLFFTQLKQSENPARTALLHTVENSLISALPATMNMLHAGLQASSFGIEDIPPELFGRWLSQDGVYRLEIHPQKDLNQAEYLREFVTEVQTVEPETTGLPIADQASGDAVVQAFQQAFLSALIAITLLLLVIFKSIKETLLVLLPLLLTSTLTCAMTVLLDMPFNFANIIALPLLLGIGVDNAIHVVARFKESPQQNPLQTSTSRAVFFASLTTLCSFSSLAFIDHPGVSSMGILLTGGIALTLLATLVILPAFCRLQTASGTEH